MNRTQAARTVTSILGGVAVFAGAVGSLGMGCLPAPPRPTGEQADMTVSVDAGGSLSARQLFETKVQPLLESTCSVCHNRSVGVGPGFLNSDPQGPGVYKTVTEWSNFIVSDPELSALLTKGQHEGPALSMSQYAAALEWLQQEKKEREASSVVPFRPQVRPFAVTLTTDKLNPQYNQIDLAQINPTFTGAYLQFIATSLNTGTGSGLEVSDLRFFNRKPGSVAGEQRSIHFNSPLFVLWKNGVPFPDPANSFAGRDITISLNQNDPPRPPSTMPTPGVLIVPGIVVLDQFRAGYSMSLLFDVIELVKPVVGASPCTANQLTYFKSNIAYRYLGAKTGPTAVSCAQSKCHDAITSVAGLDMSAALNGTVDIGPLCEQMRFYNNLSVVEKNTDPTSQVSHPFRWSPTNCMVLTGPAENPCFPTFQMHLANWRATQ